VTIRGKIQQVFHIEVWHFCLRLFAAAVKMIVTFQSLSFVVLRADADLVAMMLVLALLGP